MQIELAVCHHYRIPHSRFLRWSQDDRDKAIWAYVRDRSTCRHCGTRPEEWDEDRGGDRRAYYAVERRCLGCEQIQAKSDSLPADQGRGMYVGLKATPEAHRGE